jgi:hypothetical protein
VKHAVADKTKNRERVVLKRRGLSWPVCGKLDEVALTASEPGQRVARYGTIRRTVQMVLERPVRLSAAELILA